MLTLLFVMLAADQPDVGPARPAIDRGLAYIESAGVKWKEERGCASCHHVPMMIWTLGEAKRHGYPVNERVLSEITEWVLREDNAAKILYPADTPPEKQTFTIAATFVALAFSKTSPPPANAARFATFLMEKQNGDGSWPASGKLPVNAGVEAATIMNRMALSAPWGGDARSSVQKADEWLLAQPPSGDFQVRNLQLLLAARLNAPDSTIATLIDRLCERQNPDGGWAQLSTMPSDAFATGQALFALASARCGYHFPPTARGVAFLASSQQEDGSWPMASRKVEGAPDAKDLGPITYTGSAWAVMGLMEAVSRP